MVKGCRHCTRHTHHRKEGRERQPEQVLQTRGDSPEWGRNGRYIHLAVSGGDGHIRH
jgi:hypothetical protein